MTFKSNYNYQSATCDFDEGERHLTLYHSHFPDKKLKTLETLYGPVNWGSGLEEAVDAEIKNTKSCILFMRRVLETREKEDSAMAKALKKQLPVEIKKDEEYLDDLEEIKSSYNPCVLM